MRLMILAACLWFVTSCLHAKIVFTSHRDKDSKFMEVYTMDSDGTNQTRLTFEIGENRLPAWSPNGRQIAFENSSVGGIDLFVMDADGKNQRRLTNQRDDDRKGRTDSDSRR